MEKCVGKELDRKYEQDLAKASSLLKTLQCKCVEIRKDIKENVIEDAGFGCRADDHKYEDDFAEACKLLKMQQRKREGIRPDIKKDVLEDRGFGSKYG